jgi:hypothetical protein
MAESNLLQAEADALIAMGKYRVNDRVWDYPAPSGALSIPLISHDGREHFLLDVSRGRLNLRKGSYQNRARHVVVLVRLCFGGAPHRNPDGERIPVPHLHLYREGYGDKWALPVPRGQFPNITDLWQMLGDFMHYCHIIEPPHILRGLFS